MTINYIILL